MAAEPGSWPASSRTGEPRARTKKKRLGGGGTVLHLPNNGYKIYSVELFNETVRHLVAANGRHSYFDNRWADVQVRDVVARDEREARLLIAERFPPEDGFVVNHITAMRY
jgi:hypothetical protein